MLIVNEARAHSIDPIFRSFSVTLYVLIYNDDVKIAEAPNDLGTRGFVPGGSLKELKDWVKDCGNKDDILELANDLWTKSAVTKYIEALEQNE